MPKPVGSRNPSTISVGIGPTRPTNISGFNYFSANESSLQFKPTSHQINTNRYFILLILFLSDLTFHRTPNLHYFFLYIC
ncbi:hypothetical protein QVD17_10927 [Tagetes erecta]|uniref:Uncharacterized protein n=1 Tax=Tagetes erecta TaxID=13708 RepID=A0AAD8L237_TARER|nr:hypothetical protein QVD17_10927 [Tagetes erecta]